MQDQPKPSNSPEKTIIILLIIGLILTPFPIVGTIPAALIAFIVFILSIPLLAKGKTTSGIISLAGSIVLGALTIVVPLITTAIFAALALSGAGAISASQSRDQAREDAAAYTEDMKYFIENKPKDYYLFGKSIEENLQIIEKDFFIRSQSTFRSNSGTIYYVESAVLPRMSIHVDDRSKTIVRVDFSLPEEYTDKVLEAVMNQYSQGMTWKKSGDKQWVRDDGYTATVDVSFGSSLCIAAPERQQGVYQMPPK